MIHLTPGLVKRMGMIRICEFCRHVHDGKHVVSKYSPERKKENKILRDCIYCGLGVLAEFWVEYDKNNSATKCNGVPPSGAVSGGMLRKSIDCPKCGEKAVWCDSDTDELIRESRRCRCRACGDMK